jgi:hypothetical protein
MSIDNPSEKSVQNINRQAWDSTSQVDGTVPNYEVIETGNTGVFAQNTMTSISWYCKGDNGTITLGDGSAKALPSNVGGMLKPDKDNATISLNVAFTAGADTTIYVTFNT